MLASLSIRAPHPTPRCAALALVAATFAAAPARAQAPARPEEAFGDLNDTLMHCFLTSAYSVRADLQRAKEFALRYDLPRAITFNLGGGQGGRGLDVGSKRRTGFFLTFRGDKLYEGGGDDDGGVDDLNVAYEYLSQDDGKSWAVHTGIALIEYRQVGANAGAKYINMLVGFDTAVGDLFKLGADVSVNAATEVGQASAKHRDFDQLST
jgi:hypothetical protein